MTRTDHAPAAAFPCDSGGTVAMSMKILGSDSLGGEADTKCNLCVEVRCFWRMFFAATHAASMPERYRLGADCSRASSEEPSRNRDRRKLSGGSWVRGCMPEQSFETAMVG